MEENSSVAFHETIAGVRPRVPCSQMARMARELLLKARRRHIMQQSGPQYKNPLAASGALGRRAQLIKPEAL